MNSPSGLKLVPKLSQCPQPGQGVHAWLFHAACRCRESGLSANQAVETISARISRPPQPWCEVEDAVAAAYRERPDTSSASPPKWPKANQDLRQACAANNGGLACLASHSPADPGVWLDGSYPVLRRIFSGDPLLCCGVSKEQFDTKPLSAWGPLLSHMRLVVPNPMISPKGYTKAGKLSAHSLDNTGRRRFLVVEQDSGCADLQAAVLMELSKTAPLSLVVHSGNKSIHGWFYCEGQPEEELLRWFKDAVALGADHTMWTRSQFTRMPCGIRENGQVQRILFFNPSTIPFL